MELKGQSCKFFGSFVKIYGLYDGDHIFYVGLTTSPLEVRRVQHLSDAKYSFNKSARVKKIRQLKGVFTIKPLDILWLTGSQPWHNLTEARELEKEWIQKLTKAGVTLTNTAHNKPKRPDPRLDGVEIWQQKKSGTLG